MSQRPRLRTTEEEPERIFPDSPTIPSRFPGRQTPSLRRVSRFDPTRGGTLRTAYSNSAPASDGQSGQLPTVERPSTLPEPSFVPQSTAGQTLHHVPQFDNTRGDTLRTAYSTSAPVPEGQSSQLPIMERPSTLPDPSFVPQSTAPSSSLGNSGSFEEPAASDFLTPIPEEEPGASREGTPMSPNPVPSLAFSGDTVSYGSSTSPDPDTMLPPVLGGTNIGPQRPLPPLPPGRPAGGS
jgi:hypothetical protein